MMRPIHSVMKTMLRQGLMIPKPKPKKHSEFGRGLSYCLGLFLMHRAVLRADKENESLMQSEYWQRVLYHHWFNAASDHLYELQIPDDYPLALSMRITRFQRQCLDWGHGHYFTHPEDIGQEQVDWAVDEAKKLLRIIDRRIGVEVKKGGWE